MLVPTIYGFADEEDVERAITRRIQAVNADSKEALAGMLGEAITTLLEINVSIPHSNKHRHLIANALEAFANRDEDAPEA